MFLRGPLVFAGALLLSRLRPSGPPVSSDSEPVASRPPPTTAPAPVREPAVIGMRKLRVRVLVGGESVELTGQDSMTGFNTWSGAAGGAAKQVETWLTRRLGSPDRP